MYRIPNRLASAALSVALLLLVALPAPGQGVPDLVNYQGTLKDSDHVGLQVPEGVVLEFRVWRDATSTDAADLAWGPQVFDQDDCPGGCPAGRGVKVPVVGGRFNVMLGPVDTAAREISSAFSGGTAHLEIRVVPAGAPAYPAGVILPRQRVLSAPYAMQAEQAENAETLGGSAVTYDAASVNVDRNIRAVGGDVRGNNVAADSNITAGNNIRATSLSLPSTWPDHHANLTADNILTADGIVLGRGPIPNRGFHLKAGQTKLGDLDDVVGGYYDICFEDDTSVLLSGATVAFTCTGTPVFWSNPVVVFTPQVNGFEFHPTDEECWDVIPASVLYADGRGFRMHHMEHTSYNCDKAEYINYIAIGLRAP